MTAECIDDQWEWVPKDAKLFTIDQFHDHGVVIEFIMFGEKYDDALIVHDIRELPALLSRRDVVQQIRDKPLADRIKQPRYQDATGEDWIDQSYCDLTWSEFCGAMKFTIGKYMRRLGKKDDEVSELEKVADYAERWVKKARQRIDERV